MVTVFGLAEAVEDLSLDPRADGKMAARANYIPTIALVQTPPPRLWKSVRLPKSETQVETSFGIDPMRSMRYNSQAGSSDSLAGRFDSDDGWQGQQRVDLLSVVAEPEAGGGAAVQIHGDVQFQV